MTTDPQTLTQPQLEPCDVEAWTAIVVDRPAIALISTRPYLGVLIAKDIEEIDESRTLMHGVHWVRLPSGWRGAAMRLRARVSKVRLPEEWLLEIVSLEERPRDDMPDGVAYVANLTPDHPRGLLLPDPSAAPYPLKPLTHRQYDALSIAKGRVLHARVREMFREELRDRRRKRPIASMIPFLGSSPAPRLGPLFAG